MDPRITGSPQSVRQYLRAGDTFTLADSLSAPQRPGSRRVDLSAPLPLGYISACRRAFGLRAKGSRWTWAVIAEVMAEYHGWHRSPAWWRKEVTAMGMPPRPRGKTFTADTAEQARKGRRSGPGVKA